MVFQSTYLYKVRRISVKEMSEKLGFNPRTYIRYDVQLSSLHRNRKEFQSTYLYKVRLKFDYLF